MGKSRKTITIDDELARLVDDRDAFNLSGFVNSCLEQHFADGNAASPELAALRAELEQIERELSDIENKRDRLHEERTRIEEQLDGVEDDEPELLDQARTKLADTPRDAENPAIQNWAAKLGMPVERLLDELGPRQEVTSYE